MEGGDNQQAIMSCFYHPVFPIYRPSLHWRIATDKPHRESWPDKRIFLSRFNKIICGSPSGWKGLRLSDQSKAFKKRHHRHCAWIGYLPTSSRVPFVCILMESNKLSLYISQNFIGTLTQRGRLLLKNAKILVFSDGVSHKLWQSQGDILNPIL